ncbi:MAG: hypothetical protein JWN94_3152 [Betaproteobacteria bacterium]|nr:hypothetical protein [Betaproteobacteria bacterium]
MSQAAKAGNNCTIIQAGRDAILAIAKSPPLIRLVRLEIIDDEKHGGLRQRLNIILKNNGDVTAFLLKGSLISTGNETIRLCSQIGMQFSLSQADWTYDVNIDADAPSFVGRHSIAPNEVVNFNVMVGRKSGGHESTVYRCFLRFDFDEGNELQTDSFHLVISGPVVWRGGFQARGPSPEQWGSCQADNIRRLDSIGYDYRTQIQTDSRQYVEAVAPGIFE